MLNDVHKKDWTKFLRGALTFKAHKALSGLTVSQLQDYEICKKTVLDYYRLDAAKYLKRFRTARREPAESHKMFRARLNDYLSHYVDARGITTFENLYDDVLLQQLMYNLTPDVKAFVFAQQPKTAEEASNFADLQSQVTRGAAGNTSQRTALAWGLPSSRSGRPSLFLPKLSRRRGIERVGQTGRLIKDQHALRVAHLNINDLLVRWRTERLTVYGLITVYVWRVVRIILLAVRVLAPLLVCMRRRSTGQWATQRGLDMRITHNLYYLYGLTAIRYKQ